MKNAILFLALFTALMLTACSDTLGQSSDSKTVSVMIYSEYIDPSLLEDFEKKQTLGYDMNFRNYTITNFEREVKKANE